MAENKLLGYAIAVVAAGAAIGLRFAAEPWLCGRLPYLTMFGAVAVAVWRGGLGPALLAAAAGFLAVNALIPNHPGASPYADVAFGLALFGYSLSCAVIIGFGLSVQRAQRRLRQEMDKRQIGDRLSVAIAQQMRATFNSIGDGVIVADNEGRVLTLNPVAEALTGWSQADAANKPLASVFDILNEETRQAVVNPALRALAEGKVVGLANHTLLRARDGTERAIEDTAAPILWPDGSVHGVVLVFHDSTEKHTAGARLREAHAALEQRVAERTAELSEQRNFLEAVLEAVEDGIVACGPDGVLSLFNRATRTFHGLPEMPLPAERWAEHFDLFRADGKTPLPTAEIPLFRAFSGEAVRDVEMIIAPKGGKRRTVLASGRALRDEDGRQLGAVVSMHDITDRRDIETVRETALREQARREDAEAATERLRASEQRFSQLLESSGEGIYGMGVDSICTFFNRTGAAMLGFRPEELVGRSAHDLIHHHRADGAIYSVAECRIGLAARAGTAITVDDEVFWRKDGTAVPVRYSVNPLIAANANAGAVITFSDMTARRKADELLRASEDRVRLATDAAELGLWVWNVVDDEVAWENERLYAMFGVARDRGPIGAAAFVSDFLHREDADAFQRAVDLTIRTGARFHFEGRFHRQSDGDLRWAEFTGLLRSDVDGAPLRVIGTAADITNRKRAEDALRQFAADLSQADRRKSEFLATLAHELRNPLAPLRNGLHVMRLSNNDPTAVSRARDMMERQLAHLVHLVDDLLDIARISGGKIDIRKQTIDLKRVLASAVEISLPMIEAGAHEFVVDLPEEALLIDADPTRIAQVASNLLNNSAKFTPSGGRIELSARRDGEDVLIVVTDNGIGIPRESLTQIFEMFTQVGESLYGARGGLGIGLALVRRLVELHGGTVWAVSAGAGLGSTVTVRLPLSSIEGGTWAHGPERGAPGAGSSLRILVVDDNTDAAESLAELLQIYGYQTRVAYDGVQGIELARAFRPEVVFLDIGMPGKNGYEVARALRLTPGVERAVLVALTGWGAESDRTRSHKAGFDQHLVEA